MFVCMCVHVPVCSTVCRSEDKNFGLSDLSFHLSKVSEDLTQSTSLQGKNLYVLISLTDLFSFNFS